MNPTTLKRIQTQMSCRFTTREDRLDFLSGFFRREIATTNDLTVREAADLLIYLNTTEKWGAFDKNNPKHKVILSLLYQANWVTDHPFKGEIPDIKRLDDFLRSNKSPVRKPLRNMTPAETEKIIQALNGIVRSTWK